MSRRVSFMYHHIESRDPFFQQHMCLSRNLFSRSCTTIQRVEIRFSNNTCVFNFMYPHIESRDPFFQHHMCLSRNLLYRIRFSNNTCVFNFTYPHRESVDPFFQQHMYLEGLLGILFLGELWINFPSASRDPYVWTWFFVHQSSLSIRPSILILFHYSFPFSVLGLLG